MYTSISLKFRAKEWKKKLVIVFLRKGFKNFWDNFMHFIFNFSPIM